MQLQYQYVNGVMFDYKIDYFYVWFEGDEGWIQVNWYGEKVGMYVYDCQILCIKYKLIDQCVLICIDKCDFIVVIIQGLLVMIDVEIGYCVNSQCLLGLVVIKSGQVLEWDLECEVIMNSVVGEKLLKELSYCELWEFQKYN